MEQITKSTLVKGINYLCNIDPDLAGVVRKYGHPPIWNRESGFATLIYIILEQQVSLASARAAFTKLQQTISQVTPDHFLMLDSGTLKNIGFSRQKSGYAINLAQLIIQGRLDLEKLNELPDERVRDILIEIKGIGHWTIDIYLLMALNRADIWPSGDLALISAFKEVKKYHADYTGEKMNKIAESWRPWRSVAARILWHFYLSERQRTVKRPKV